MDRLTACIASMERVEASPELAERVGVELDQLPALDQEVLRARFGARDEAHASWRQSLLAILACQLTASWSLRSAASLRCGGGCSTSPPPRRERL